jgi:hypothetical protein
MVAPAYAVNTTSFVSAEPDPPTIVLQNTMPVAARRPPWSR